jgi:hypothetical protein
MRKTERLLGGGEGVLGMEAREAITASWRASRAGVSVSNVGPAPAAALPGAAPSDAGPVVCQQCPSQVGHPNRGVHAVNMNNGWFGTHTAHATRRDTTRHDTTRHDTTRTREDDVRPKKQSRSIPLAWPDRGWLLDEAVEEEEA